MAIVLHGLTSYVCIRFAHSLVGYVLYYIKAKKDEARRRKMKSPYDHVWFEIPREIRWWGKWALFLGCIVAAYWLIGPC